MAILQENGMALKYATLAVRSDLPVVLANLLSNHYLNLLSSELLSEFTIYCTDYLIASLFTI